VRATFAQGQRSFPLDLTHTHSEKKKKSHSSTHPPPRWVQQRSKKKIRSFAPGRQTKKRSPVTKKALSKCPPSNNRRLPNECPNFRQVNRQSDLRNYLSQSSVHLFHDNPHAVIWRPKLISWAAAQVFLHLFTTRSMLIKRLSIQRSDWTERFASPNRSAPCFWDGETSIWWISWWKLFIRLAIFNLLIAMVVRGWDLLPLSYSGIVKSATWSTRQSEIPAHDVDILGRATLYPRTQPLSHRLTRLIHVKMKENQFPPRKKTGKKTFHKLPKL